MDNSRDRLRGPFIVLSVWGDDGSHAATTYRSADELRAACREELREIREERRARGGKDAEDDEEVGSATGDEQLSEERGDVTQRLSLDELVLLVMKRTKIADSFDRNRYGWKEVVEGGQLMRIK